MVLKGQNYVECNLFLSGIKMAVLAPHSCTAKIDNIAYFPNLQQQDSIRQRLAESQLLDTEVWVLLSILNQL